ncbi:unnamed protein product [Symbiodinium sp. CCMP2592]|nr:unnamed protein product [Symbiodinium sp. CCMP2592]
MSRMCKLTAHPLGPVSYVLTFICALMRWCSVHASSISSVHASCLQDRMSHVVRIYPWKVLRQLGEVNASLQVASGKELTVDYLCEVRILCLTISVTRSRAPGFYAVARSANGSPPEIYSSRPSLPSSSVGSTWTQPASEPTCPGLDPMELDAISPAEAGGVDVLVLDPSSDPALEECLSSPCACYCVLKRPGGCLLALPSAAVSEPALSTAEAAGHPGLVGPFLALTCKAISLTESGEWATVCPPRQLQVRVVDFDAAVCGSLSPLTGSVLDFVAFDPSDPTLYTIALEVVASAIAWLRTRPGDRGANGYVTAEEPPAPEGGEGPTLGRQPKVRGADPKAKKITLAGLAAQQGTGCISDPSCCADRPAAAFRTSVRLLAAARRMDPSVLPGASGSASVPVSSGTMTQYLERFGGYSKDRTMGLAQWQCAIAMARGAADTISLLMVFLEQATLDRTPDFDSSARSSERPVLGEAHHSYNHAPPLADQRMLATTLADPGADAAEATLSRKQLRAQLWAAKKAKGGQEKINFIKWAAALPRLLLAAKTRFSRLLRSSFSIAFHEGEPPPPTALFPLPVPCPGAFGKAGLELRSRSARRALRLGTLIDTSLHIAVMALNHVHSDSRPVQRKVFARLRLFIEASSRQTCDFLLLQVRGRVPRNDDGPPRRGIPENALPYPDTGKESRDEMLRIFDLWDSLSLLQITPAPADPKELCRVFGSYKSPTWMIGDRRGPNALEGGVIGVSGFLPQGFLLASLSVRPGFALCGASTDRSDYYHQIRATAQRASTNCVGPPLRLSSFKDPLVCGSFRAILQGDHGGVEYATALVIDDYFAVSEVPAKELRGLSGERLAERLRKTEASACIAQAKLAYEHAGLAGSDHKDNWGSLLFTVAGAEVNSEVSLVEQGAVLVGAPLQRRLALSYVTLKAAACPVTSEDLMSSLLGAWVSYLQFRRPFSCFLDTAFKLAAKSPTSTDSSARALPRKAADELGTLAACAPLLASNIAVSTEFAEALWHAGAKKGHYTRLTSSRKEPSSEGEGIMMPSMMIPLRLSAYGPGPAKQRPLGMDYDFIELLSPSGSLSAEVSKTGLRVGPWVSIANSPELDLLQPHVAEWLTYLVSRRRVRVENSLVGRAFVLLELCRRLGTPCLLRVSPGSFVTDLPWIRAFLERPGASWFRSSIALLGDAYQPACAFVGAHVYGVAKPSVQHLASSKAPSGCLPLGMPMTSAALIAAYILSLPAVRPLDTEALVELLVIFGRDLYNSGRPYWHFSETINALTATKPGLRRSCQAAWDLAFTWLAEEPSTHHIAMPPLVLIAIIASCLAWGWVREAGLFALAWGALLRISEATNATRRHLVFPADALNMQSFVLIKIDQPKTCGRAAKHQAAKLEQSNLVAVASLAFFALPKQAKLWPFANQTLRRRLDSILERLGIPKSGEQGRSLDLGSLRPGGATHLLQLTEDSELVRRRGRWASHKVMEIYLQEVAASTFVADLSDKARENVFQLAQRFPGMLAQAQTWAYNNIPSRCWFYLWPSASSVCRADLGCLGSRLFRPFFFDRCICGGWHTDDNGRWKKSEERGLKTEYDKMASVLAEHVEQRLCLYKAGQGGFDELQDGELQTRSQKILRKVLRTIHGLTKHVLVHWVGPGVSVMRRGLDSARYGQVANLVGRYCAVAFRKEVHCTADLRLEMIIHELQRLTVVDSTSGGSGQAASRISVEEYNIAMAEESRHRDSRLQRLRPKPQAATPRAEHVTPTQTHEEPTQAAPALPDLSTALRAVRDPTGRFDWVIFGWPAASLRLPPSPCRASWA